MDGFDNFVLPGKPVDVSIETFESRKRTTAQSQMPEAHTSKQNTARYIYETGTGFMISTMQIIEMKNSEKSKN